MTAIALDYRIKRQLIFLKEAAEEARQLAAEDLKEEPSAIKEECATKNFYVFGTDRKGKHPVRILDKKDLSKCREMMEKLFFVKRG